jgi:DNA-binding MarR family transcriptional regulator
VYTSINARGIDACACSAVKKLSRVLGRSYDAELASAGLNITQFAVLRSIARRSGDPLVRVAEEMEMDRTSLYRAIAPMIREGWLVSVDGVDARSKTAEITTKGRRLLASANKNWDKVQRRVIGQFGEAKYLSLLSELDRLAQCARGANT